MNSLISWKYEARKPVRLPTNLFFSLSSLCLYVALIFCLFPQIQSLRLKHQV